MTHQQTTTKRFQNVIGRTSIETARFFHPDELLTAIDLNCAEKRAVLAGWLSDARAVPDSPGLRQLDCGAVVRVDDLMQALTSLDELTPAPDKFASGLSSPYPRRGLEARISELLRRITRRKSDDDDDPPPCPAGVRPRSNGPLGTAPQEALIDAAA
jgi:hypothetical protein